MRRRLAARGHEVFTPTYTGLGERAHLASPANDLQTHIHDVHNVLEFEDLRDVVLVGHSYGGMVATGVADQARDRIARLIYLDAFVPSDGQALVDLVPPAARQRMRDSARESDGWRVAPNPPPADTSAADVEWVKRLRMPQSLACFEQPVRLTAPVRAPRSYIQCMRYADKGPFGQFAAQAKAAAGWRCFELDASHSPNITAADALAELVQEILAD
jgi:pimeloyl-ACP methyl ester carboxylesterase